MEGMLQPAGDGLLGSGRVVSMLSADSPMTFRVDSARAVVLAELPGTPCAVLLGFTPGAAVRFAEQLRIGFDALCADRTGTDQAGSPAAPSSDGTALS